ncbi:MAG: prolyl oligopeptidase family serine peptidase [Planctomycetaceae bacterium]|nr:prolyl oligopeptidase family serine peptidase [Planctomycetaceae bacterium]
MKTCFTLCWIVLLAAPVIADRQTLPKVERFDVNGQIAVVYEATMPAKGKPWVWYAPTLKGGISLYGRTYYRDAFFAAGLSIAGYDLGEVRGSPESTAKFHKFYEVMVERGYSAKPILLGQSRGGMMLLSWAVDHPQNVGAFVGIYPVLNLSSWPLQRSEAATLADFKLTRDEFVSRLDELNPINRLSGMIEHKVPVFIVHGDSDLSVPYNENSALLKERYEKESGRIEVKLIPGEGHKATPAFFECSELVNFVLSVISPD